MTRSHIVAGLEGAVGTITLAREDKANALSEALRDELIDALDGYASDDGVRVVLLGGGPRVFSAGFDLGEVAATRFATFSYRFEEYNAALYGFPKPIVAAVAGPALAGGCDLALAADVIVAAETAEFGHPEVAFGAVPSVALLAPRVGEARAAELAMTGRRVGAAEALRIGLADRVVPAEDLASAALATASELARHSAATLRGLRAATWEQRDVLPRIRREYALSERALRDPENLARLEAYFARLGRP